MYADSRSRLIGLLSQVRPERPAGGFSFDDGTIAFYTRVNALISSRSTLVNFGAGRGQQFDVPDPGYVQEIQQFQNRVSKVIGIDVDDGVLSHPFLDERHVVKPAAPLPIPAQTIDVVIADWVLEHIEQPGAFVAEMERLVRPGGWVCARTVNRWGYVGIGARLIPNAFHGALVGRLTNVVSSADVFPTVYRMNSLSAIRSWFSPDRWDHFSYVINTTPRYCAGSKVLFRAIELYQRFMPRPLGTDLFVFLQRKISAE